MGGSKMLVGVELLVVQLKGEEPNDSCDELHMQNTLDVMMTGRPDLLIDQALLGSSMLGPYRGVDKKEFPGLNSEVCWYAAADPWSRPDTCTHRHHMKSTLSSTQHQLQCQPTV